MQGTEGPWDCDDFTSVPITDDHLDAIRIRCLELDHPWQDEMMHELMGMVKCLRNEST